MSPQKRIGPKGFTTVYSPFHQDLFISENYTTDSQTDGTIIKSPPQPSVMAGNSSNQKCKREGSHKVHKSARSTPLRLERRLCPSVRRLQAKMEIEKHQMKETMDQLLNTETHFVKEVEDVLNQHDTREQRRRELLHKHWTERLWLPLQKQLNQYVSSCGATEIKRRQGLYCQYIQHCNSKGYVFLDIYNPEEYNPFLPPSKKFHYVKLAEIRTIPKEAWTSDYLETDSKNSSRQDDKLPPSFQTSLVSSRSVTPRTQHGTPSSYSASTFMKTPRVSRLCERLVKKQPR